MSTGPALQLPQTPAFQDQVWICVEDPTNCRLIEGLTAQLGLDTHSVGRHQVDRIASAKQAAMIIADETVASNLRRVSPFFTPAAEAAAPALVAVLPTGSGESPLLPKQNGELPYDGVLILPQVPTVLLAQLSVILYAHRAYVRRFESAMEELELNRRIFRSVTSGISVASASEPDFPLVYVNPAFEVMTGYSLENVMGRNCRFLQGDDRDQPGLTLIREAIQQRRETVATIRNYKKDGTPFWNELLLSPIMDRAGKVTHFVGIQHDVTERVIAEQALRDGERLVLEEALRDSEKLAAAGRLAASIAHEINNPLATVTTLVYLARNEVAHDQRNQILDLAGEELHRVSRLTTQSLHFYRQSSKPTAVRPVDLVSLVLDVYSVKMQHSNITLERRDSTCQSIVCLESEIRQVLSNLIRNSMDALEASHGRILVRVREATSWPERTRGVVITVADTGCGMSPDTRSRLYTAFSTTKEQKGTGLGLWVSKGIVDRHQGKIRVRSRQGRPCGTVFQVFLPYQSLATWAPPSTMQQPHSNLR